MENQAPDDIMRERLGILQEKLQEQQTAFNRKCVGCVMPVLLDRKGRHAGQLVGRSPYMQPVHAAGSEHLIGRIVDLKMASASGNSLAGVFLENEGDLTPAAKGYSA